APPWRFDGERMPVRHAPPQLGEGTQEVLQSLLGYSAEQLAGLKDKGVI
ncbi:MAG TPA: CoA transferase, partial [Paraburkholderia sp.]|nr:CoA transferase [Paraburkholderia sp.]